MSLSRRYTQEMKDHGLWFDGLLLGRLTLRPEQTELYPLTVAEAAYAAAWASLSLQPTNHHCLPHLRQHLQQTANFLHSLKPDRSRPGAADLRERLLKMGGQGHFRQEIWAYLLGDWIRKASGSAVQLTHEDLLEIGWPVASFGLGYWLGRPIFYRLREEFHRLVLPFERKDALEILGPFETLTDPGRPPSGQRLMLASPRLTQGLRPSPLWKLESMIAGNKGVLLTKTGHVHRQFASEDLPEWFEAIEVTFKKGETDLDALLISVWNTFHRGRDLLFYTEDSQRSECLQVWRRFAASQPEWAVSHPLMLHQGTWFDPAPPQKQKQALTELGFLRHSLGGLNLTQSHLATKLNAFAGGYGRDEDVVILAARYGLSAGLTTTLRLIRYFSARSAP